MKTITILTAILLSCLSIIGCASTQWVHSYKNEQDFEADKYDCEKTAEQSAANWGSPGNPFMILNEMKKCLQYKHGWQKTTKKEAKNN